MESYNPPSANMWKAVAEALSQGFSQIPIHAREGMVIGALLGIAMAIIDHLASPKVKRYLPSAMGLGLSWVMPFQNSFAFFIGALIAWVWSKRWPHSGDMFIIPIASGAIAGESLMCAVIAMITAAQAIGAH